MEKNRNQSLRKRKRGKNRRKIICLCIVLLICAATVCIVIHKQENKKEARLLVPLKAVSSEKNRQGDSAVNGEESSDEEEWSLSLVNKWNPIIYETDIVTTELSNGECVDERIYSQLQQMFDAARNDGVYPMVASGYRTAKKQEEIYHNKMLDYKKEGLSDEEAKRETELWVAIPGTSEHQLGLAVDINADGIHSKGTDVYEWLKDNAHLYGFINRYPLDKTDITGVADEPWHYRYVGIKAAAKIDSQNICLEEYLDKTN